MDTEIIETEFCVHCGEAAACVGAYEGAQKWSAACDTCCVHGNEDGHCEPVGRYAQRTIKALQAALGEAVREAKSAKARIADACLAHNKMEHERDTARRELAIAEGFHKVAVAERNLAWHQLEAAQKRLAELEMEQGAASDG